MWDVAFVTELGQRVCDLTQAFILPLLTCKIGLAGIEPSKALDVKKVLDMKEEHEGRDKVSGLKPDTRRPHGSWHASLEVGCKLSSH